jgi:hypothetical protein
MARRRHRDLGARDDDHNDDHNDRAGHPEPGDDVGAGEVVLDATRHDDHAATVENGTAETRPRCRGRHRAVERRFR